MAGMSLKGKGILTLLYTSVKLQKKILSTSYSTIRNPKGTDLSVCILKMSDDTVIEVRLCGFSFEPRPIELS